MTGSLRALGRRLAVSTLILLVWLFTDPRQAGAQLKPSQEAGEQAQVSFGVYVISVDNLDFFKGTFEVAFWTWWVFDEEDYLPHEQIEIINSADYKIETVVRRDLGDGSQHLAAKFVARLRQDWDLRHFPFDRQRMHIVIESVGLRAHQLQFLPDIESSGISDDWRLSGWELRGLNLIPENHAYDSTFGVPGEQPSVYPRMTAEIVIERANVWLFLSVFVGYVIAFLITTLHYFVDVLPLQARMNMLMGSIFAAIGNKYIVDTNYPPPDTFSLSEKVAIATFALIAIGFLVTVISASLLRSERKAQVARLNRTVVMVTVPLYLALVGRAVYVGLTSG